MIKIIHVDDDQDDLEITELNLNRIGSDISFKQARSGRQALEELGRGEYDCVLSDLQMPGMDGLELLRRVRSGGSDIPFIFLTGQGNEIIAAKALRSGADDYFTKEIGFANYDRLVHNIRRVVEARKHARKRREAEESLLKSESLLRSVFRATPDHFVVLDSRINVIFDNRNRFDIGSQADAADEQSGVKKPDVLNYYTIKSIARKVLQTGRVQRVEENDDVTGRASEISAFAVLGENEDIVLAVVHIRDISDRKRAELAILASEARYRALFDNSKDAVFITDTEWNIIDINESGAALFGYLRSQLNSMNLLSLVAEHSERKLLKRGKSVLRRAEAKQLRFRKKDKSLITTIMTAHEQLSPQGDVIGYQGCLHDITALVEAERRLKLSEQRFRDLADKAWLGIVCIDARGRGTYANDAFCDMIGYAREEIIGRHFASVLHKDCKWDILKEFWSAFMGVTTRHANRIIDFKVVHKKGHCVCLRCRPTVFMFEGRIEGFSGIFIDVTEDILGREGSAGG